MLKTAVIGLGHMGSIHADMYKKISGVQLVALVDNNPNAAFIAGQRFGVPTFATTEAMFEQHRPDLISVAVPTRQHYRVAHSLIKQGIHVIIEKPIAFTVAEAEALAQEAESQNVILAVGFNERYNGAFIALKHHLYDAGILQHIKFQRIGPLPQRLLDTGVILDVALHDLDLLFHLFATDSVAETQYKKMYSRNGDYEDVFNATLTLESGVQVSLEASWASPITSRCIVVTGTAGTICCDLLAQTLAFHGPSHTVEYDVTPANSVLAELTDLCAGVNEHRVVSVTAREAIHSLSVALDYVAGKQHNPE